MLSQGRWFTNKYIICLICYLCIISVKVYCRAIYGYNCPYFNILPISLSLYFSFLSFSLPILCLFLSFCLLSPNLIFIDFEIKLNLNVVVVSSRIRKQINKSKQYFIKNVILIFKKSAFNYFDYLAFSFYFCPLEFCKVCLPSIKKKVFQNYIFNKIS